ncbi:ABC transporter permease (plasmid) [Nitratireductor aquimarinus]|uniref:ABC transporter permease n=1 Tax=Nitratireductor TaxID=245876 RepID=UPI002629CF3A|nr:ABC transporter permease [Nitratireductor sp.]MCV0378922.1 ABC transporter permease [Nitratireductor sp.]
MLGAFNIGYRDLVQSVQSRNLWLLLGWVEIRQRYARSRIGPFWLTISMAVLVAALGLVYGTLFKADIRDYLPLLAIGFVFWAYISTTINDGCNAYIGAGAYLKQVPLPRGVFIFQNLWRNMIILAHNFVIVVLVLIIFKVNFLQNLPFFFLGFLLVTWNLLWTTALLALLCARFRDLPQIVASIIQVIFYVTPILFKRDMLGKYPWLIDLNPFAHLIEVVRAPLLGGSAPALSWAVCLSMALVGSLLCLFMHGKYRARIPYWV